jgi:exonuclease III
MPPDVDDHVDRPCNQSDDDAESTTPSNDSIHNLSDQNYQCFARKGLHFIHVNARSVVNKLTELSVLAHKTKASIIAVSETWLDSTITDSEAKVEGYNLVRKDRDRHGGGVCLYIRENLSFNPRLDLQRQDVEAVFVDIMLPKTKPITVGAMYRPPKQSNFLELYQETLSQIDLSNELYILGDFNICVKIKNSTLFGKYRYV